MSQPLALVYYETLMPGSQLVNKMRDLNYRVQTASDPVSFHLLARDEKPLLAIEDLAGGDAACSAIAALKADASTADIPVIAFGTEGAIQWLKAAQDTGAKLVVSETNIANYLPELLNQTDFMGVRCMNL